MNFDQAMHDAPLPEGRGVYAATDGAWKKLDGNRIMLLSADGRSLAVELSQWSSDRIVSFVTHLDDPGGDVDGSEAAHVAASYCSLVVYPGAGNSFALAVETRSREDGALLSGGAGTPWEYVAHNEVSDEERVPLDSDFFLFHLGSKRFVRLHLQRGGVGPRSHLGLQVLTGPLMTTKQVEAFQTGGPLLTSNMTLRFGGVNVLHVDASPPREFRPIG